MPGGIGRQEILRQILTDESWVSAMDDRSLVMVRRHLPDDLDVELVPFGSLVARFAGMMGDTGFPRLTRPQMRSMIQAVAAGFPDSSLIYAAANLPGLAEAFANAITELHYHGYTSADLVEAASQTTNSLTAMKLSQLGELDRQLRQIATESSREFGIDRAKFCLDLEEIPELRERHVVIYASQESQPVYEDWIAWLAKTGTVVDLIVEQIPGQIEVFRASRQTVHRIAPTRMEQPDEPTWIRHLFTDTKASESPEIEIWQTGDPLAECEWVCRECQKLIAQGMPEESIGVYARNSESYLPLMVASARRLGVRIAGSMSAPVLSNGFAGLTLKILQVLGGSDIRKLERVVRSTYFGLEPAERAWLIQAIKSSREAVGDAWSALQTHAESAPEGEWLRSLLNWRKRSSEASMPMSGWAVHFRDLWEGTRVLERAAHDYEETRERDLKAMTVLQRSLRDAVLQDRDTPLDFAGFLAKAEELWDLERVLWSRKEAGVHVTSSTSELSGFSVLFCLGMLEGTFPRRRTEDPVLDDFDRAELAKLCPNRPPLTTSHDTAKAERDEFIRICGSAKDRLVLSYPMTQDESDAVPAFYLSEVERASARGAKRVLHRRKDMTPPVEECYAVSDSVLARALDGPRIAPEVPRVTDPVVQAMIRPVWEEGVDLRELSIASVCPFQAAMRYRLPMKPKGQYGTMYWLSRIPAEAQLAEAPDAATARMALRAAVDRQREELAGELESWQSRLIDDAVTRVIDSWVRKEFAARAAFGLTNQKLDTNVRTGGDHLRGKIKFRDVDVPIRAKFPAAWSGEGSTTLTSYESSVPGTAKDVDKTPALRFRLGLTMAMLRDNPDYAALQVDSIDGSRVLFVLAGSAFNLPDEMPEDLKVVVYPIQKGALAGMAARRQLKKESWEHALRVLEELDRGEMLPKPGTQCERCSYSDLCRRHIEFGDFSSPLEEDYA